MTIQIHEISAELFGDLEKTSGYERTAIAPGEAIAMHRHGFGAMYFTQGVEGVVGEGKQVALPMNAAVFVSKGTEHGWSGVQIGLEQAVVGYFHVGHGVHTKVKEYMSRTTRHYRKKHQFLGKLEMQHFHLTGGMTYSCRSS